MCGGLAVVRRTSGMKTAPSSLARLQRAASGTLRAFSTLLVLMGKLILVGLVLAGEPTRKPFNLPAADAAIALKLFAEQAGQECSASRYSRDFSS